MPSDTTSSNSTNFVERNYPWRPIEASLLESLLEVPDTQALDIYRTAVPWQNGYELSIVGSGGIQELEDRRVVIAALQHTSYVGGNLNKTVTGQSTLHVHGDVNLSVGEAAKASAGSSAGSSSEDSGTSASTALTGVPFGEDKLTVIGDATWDVGDRMTLMTGAIRRNWNGRVMRMAGMEGVICAGLHLRTIAGVSMSVSALMSGDVYGGAARAALLRMHVGGFMYRSVELCAWAGLAYVRSTNVTIEPVLGTPTQHTPETRLWMKLGRLALALCPFADMAIGIATIQLNLAIAIGGAIASKVKKDPPQPPAGRPRSRTRVVGVISEMKNIDLMM